jgi:hypothetical protein
MTKETTEENLPFMWLWFSDRIQDNPSPKFELFLPDKFDDLIQFIVKNQLPEEALDPSEIVIELSNLPTGVQSKVGGLVTSKTIKAY